MPRITPQCTEREEPIRLTHRLVGYQKADAPEEGQLEGQLDEGVWRALGSLDEVPPVGQVPQNTEIKVLHQPGSERKSSTESCSPPQETGLLFSVLLSSPHLSTWSADSCIRRYITGVTFHSSRVGVGAGSSGAGNPLSSSIPSACAPRS